MSVNLLVRSIPAAFDRPPLLCMIKHVSRGQQLRVDFPAEDGGANITQYLIDVDTVSTFSSNSLVTLWVDSAEVGCRFVQ